MLQKNLFETVHLEFVVNVLNAFCKCVVGQFSSMQNTNH